MLVVLFLPPYIYFILTYVVKVEKFDGRYLSGRMFNASQNAVEHGTSPFPSVFAFFFAIT
jgi:hypothetical protein